jgi:UDP-glucose 4-epimerase
MLKILVTGGRGFLGSHTCQILEEQGYEVIDTDIQGDGTHLNVADFHQVEEVFSESRPEVVIHLAALVAGGPSKSKPYEYFMVNTLGTINVLEACRRNNIQKLIHMSSFSIFGKTVDTITESTPLQPANPYGGSKASAEYVVKTYSRCYDIKTLIFRACLIAGEEQNEYNAIQEFVDCALKSEPLLIFGSGDHKREWIHPSDVARAFVLGTKHLQSLDQPFDTFNLGSGEPISMKRLAEKILEISGSSSEIVHKDYSGVRFDQITDTSKVRETLDWKPKVSLKEIISRVIEWRKG